MASCPGKAPRPRLSSLHSCLCPFSATARAPVDNCIQRSHPLLSAGHPLCRGRVRTVRRVHHRRCYRRRLVDCWAAHAGRVPFGLPLSLLTLDQGADTLPCLPSCIGVWRLPVPVPRLLSFGPYGNQIPIDAAAIPLFRERVVMLMKKPEQGRPFAALKHRLWHAGRNLRLPHDAPAPEASARSCALRVRTRFQVWRAAPAWAGLPLPSQASSVLAHSQTASQLMRRPFHCATRTS